MTEQENAFWEWWDEVSDREGLLNARQAFDAGYEAATKQLER